MAWRAILAASVVGCTAPGQKAAPPPQSCLDQKLAAKGLNQFGDPEGTMYPGGTPLFDEKTGKRTDRAAYVFARHPDIARACDAGP
jgi:hypothetical protein